MMMMRRRMTTRRITMMMMMMRMTTSTITMMMMMMMMMRMIIIITSTMAVTSGVVVVVVERRTGTFTKPLLLLPLLPLPAPVMIALILLPPLMNLIQPLPLSPPQLLVPLLSESSAELVSSLYLS
ncbi:hypothetical protein EDC94DRAFT_616159, partial [Helicostylum pulchrum]